jgi:hypothetical protein
VTEPDAPVPTGPQARPPQPLALLAYYGLAVLAAVIVVLNVVPYPLDIVVLLAIGLGATWIRYRTAGRDSIGSSMSWLAVFIVVWLPLAWMLGRFPFGS